MQFNRSMRGYLERNMNEVVLNYEICYERVLVVSAFVCAFDVSISRSDKEHQATNLLPR